jgi:hypothetical protein
LLQELPVRTAIRSILVYLPAATIVDRTMDVAMPLAKRFGADVREMPRIRDEQRRVLIERRVPSSSR